MVYFYLSSFLSSFEKAKWVVVDSFFTTSIPKIVLAAYSGVVGRGRVGAVGGGGCEVQNDRLRSLHKGRKL